MHFFPCFILQQYLVLTIGLPISEKKNTASLNVDVQPMQQPSNYFSSSKLKAA